MTTTLSAAIREIRDPNPRHIIHLSKNRQANLTRCGIEIVRDGKGKTRRPFEPRYTVGGATVLDRSGIVSCGKCLGAVPEGRIR